MWWYFKTELIHWFHSCFSSHLSTFYNVGPKMKVNERAFLWVSSEHQHAKMHTPMSQPWGSTDSEALESGPRNPHLLHISRGILIYNRFEDTIFKKCLRAWEAEIQQIAHLLFSHSFEHNAYTFSKKHKVRNSNGGDWLDRFFRSLPAHGQEESWEKVQLRNGPTAPHCESEVTYQKWG